MLLWIAIGCAGCSTAAAAATLCTDVLRRSARLLLLPSGFPPWSDRVPAFAWWGDPAAVRVVPQLRHRADSPHQDPIHDCLTIADGTNKHGAVAKARRLHVCLGVAPVNAPANASRSGISSSAVRQITCLSPPSGLKGLTHLTLDVTPFGGETTVEAWIQVGPHKGQSRDQSGSGSFSTLSWTCCNTTTLVIAPRAISDFLKPPQRDPQSGHTSHYQKLTRLWNVRRASEWAARPSDDGKKTTIVDTDTTAADDTSAGDTFEVGYLAGVDTDNWWFHPSKSPIAYRIFDTNMLYATDDGYESHQAHLLPAWSGHYASSVLRYCHALRGAPCRSVIEFGSASCYITAALRDALLRTATAASVDQPRPSIDFLAIEAARSGVEACHTRGIRRVVEHDLRLPLGRKVREKKYDVAVCTEVAEHIEPPFASQLVLNLVQSSDVVWFSSALPQSQKEWFPFNHVHHMNEQHDAFWINLFHFFGYEHVRPVPHPGAADDLSAPDDQALRQRGRLVFYNPDTVHVDDERLLSFAKGSCRGGAGAKGDDRNAGEGASHVVVGRRDLCAQVLDVYGKDDESKFARWFNAWEELGGGQ